MTNFTRTMLHSWRVRLTVVALAVAGLVAIVWTLPAQEPAPPGYQTYVLQHAQPADLARQVREVIVQGDPKAELVIDQQRRALLVRGSDEAQRLAAGVISALDRPAGTAAAAPAEKEPVVRAYRIEGKDGDRLLADLKRKFPERNGIKLAIDRRTGQLVAVAPPSVHQKIAEELEGRAVPQIPQGAAGEPTEKRGHTLKNISWQSFEDFLQRIWRDKATVETGRTGEVASFRVRNAAGQEAVATVDRRHNEVSFEGTRTASQHWARLVSVLDGGPAPKNESVQLVPVRRADPEQLHGAIQMIRTAIRQGALQAGTVQTARALPTAQAGSSVGLVARRIFQQEGQDEQEDNNQPQPNQPNNQQPPDENQPQPQAPEGAAEELLGGAFGPVQIEFLEGLDVIIIRGNKRDVERVTKIIQDIENISEQTRPVIEIYMMQHADSTQAGELVVELYNQALAARYGRISITPLDKPNALVLIGRQDSVDAVRELVRQFDVPVDPDTQFRTYQLRYLSAAEAKRIMDEFYAERQTLGTQVRVSIDPRTNAVIINASPRDLVEAEKMLASLDRDDRAHQNELRIVQLSNALATELVPVLQAAISGQGGGATTQPGQVPGQQPTPGGTTTGGGPPFSPLTFAIIEREGGRLLQSGILADVTITADPNGNAVIVRGPAKSMDLIVALIEQLDRLPQSEAQIKVFTIVNGDATMLATMLQQLFGQTTGLQGGGAQNIFAQPITAGGENTLVPIRFAVDPRTNSIIVSGAPGDLNVVHLLLLRLDEGDIRQRRTTVYRLKNAPAIAVAQAINQFLTNERAVQLQLGATLTSPFEQLEREVVVVPEQVSNSLIVSATPRFYDEIARVVEELDARPPMVMIQVVIAEVSLNDFEEFGAEFGLQDSLLFDRGVVANNVVTPGFNFNNQPLGNASSPASLATRENLAGQSLSHFGVGRTNGALGYGGLVLSASNESISILIRALQDAQRLQVLSRPQVMTLDNQSAFVQVGQRVPRITSVQTGNLTQGNVNSIDLDNVGLLLGVTPRISPDGLVVMEIDAEKSELGPIDQGIPVSFGPNGEVIRQPIINTTLAQTTVSARSGQTVILGGLITKTRGYSSRRIPYLSDIPVLGRMFRYDSANEERTELLIIMTPHIVKTEADAEWIKQVESDRMSWCLADVVEMHGDAGLSGGYGLWGPAHGPVIYPDIDPTGLGAEMIVPAGDMPPLRRYPTTPSGTMPDGAAPTLEPPTPQTIPPPGPARPDLTPAQSSRRVPHALPLEPIPDDAPMTTFKGKQMRVQQSDNATIYYAEPKPKPKPPQRGGGIDVSPAVYQQGLSSPPAWQGAAASPDQGYGAQPAYLPAR